MIVYTDFQLQARIFAPTGSECLFVWFRLCSFSSSFVMHTIFVISITCLLLWQVAMLFNITFVLDQDSLSICCCILLIVFKSRWILLQIEQITRFGNARQFCLLQSKTTSVMQMQSYFKFFFFVAIHFEWTNNRVKSWSKEPKAPK